MPCYDFQCRNKKCQITYDDLVPYDPTGKYKGVKCPECGSKKKKKLLTVCREVIFTDPRGTSKGDSFTYVAGHNMEQAKAERRNAEAKSHMGTKPYREINDLSGKDRFDFGKL